MNAKAVACALASSSSLCAMSYNIPNRPLTQLRPQQFYNAFGMPQSLAPKAVNGAMTAPAIKNRYLDEANLRRCRYQTKKPELRHTKLREDTNPQGHVHVNAAINLDLPRKRRENIARYGNKGHVKRVFGTLLDYGKTDNDLLTIDQNDPVFLYRYESVPSGFINTLAEVTSTVFGRLNGLPIDEHDTQQTFERKFRFAGWAVTRKAYYEPGSRLAVAVAGSRTIWLGPTNVDWGDRLAWRFPSIDPTVRAQESVSCPHMPNDRPSESYGAIIERMDPMDVVLMPQSTLTRYLKMGSNAERRKHLRDMATRRIVNDNVMLPSADQPIDATESWFINHYLATQWYGLAGALFAYRHKPSTLSDLGKLFGFQLTSENGVAPSLHAGVNHEKVDTFFGMANRPLFTDHIMQGKYIDELKTCVRASFEGGRSEEQEEVVATLERMQSVCGTASMIALTVAVEEHNSRFVGIAHQRGYGSGKCDVYS